VTTDALINLYRDRCPVNYSYLGFVALVMVRVSGCFFVRSTYGPLHFRLLLSVPHTSHEFSSVTVFDVIRKYGLLSFADVRDALMCEVAPIEDLI